MAELKPCPFCGGEAGLFHIKGVGNDLCGYMVGCTEDDCAVRPSVQSELGETAVIEVWNRRAGE